MGNYFTFLPFLQWLYASNRIDDLLAWLTQASPSYSVYEVTRDISRREIELRRIKDGEDLSVELSTDDEIDLESRIFSVGARVDYRVADLWRQGLVVQVSGNQMLVKIEDAEGEQPEKWIHMVAKLIFFYCWSLSNFLLHAVGRVHCRGRSLHARSPISESISRGR